MGPSGLIWNLLVFKWIVSELKTGLGLRSKNRLSQFFPLVNLSPSQRILGHIQGVIVYGGGYPDTHETSIPSPWPNPRYLPAPQFKSR